MHSTAPVHHPWLKRLRRWFLTGLILSAPAFVTFLALRWVFSHVDTPLRELLANLTGYDIPGIGFLSVVILLVVTGAVASTFAIRGIIHWFEATLDRIPLVRTLYSGVKQLLAPLADESSASVQQVVIVPYPDSNNYSIGFLIKANIGQSPDGEPLSSVLIPSNHLHLGFVVLCPNRIIREVNLNAEEALKFLVSMGAAIHKPITPGRTLHESLDPARLAVGAAPRP